MACAGSYRACAANEIQLVPRSFGVAIGHALAKGYDKSTPVGVFVHGADALHVAAFAMCCRDIAGAEGSHGADLSQRQVNRDLTWREPPFDN